MKKKRPSSEAIIASGQFHIKLELAGANADSTRAVRALARLLARSEREPSTEAPAEPAEIRIVDDPPRAAPVGAVEVFLAERCDLAYENWVPVRELVAAYRGWCAERHFCLVKTRIWIHTLLTANFRQGRGRRRGGRQLRSWEGLRLRVVSIDAAILPLEVAHG